MEWLAELRRVQGIAPLIAVQSPDQYGTLDTIIRGLDGALPMLCWDIINGIRGVNEKGRREADRLEKMLPPSPPPLLPPLLGAVTTDPVNAINIAKEMTRASMLILMNAHRFIGGDAMVQGVMNLRNLFEKDGRTLLMLGPGFTLPPEYHQDVLLIDQPLPDIKQLTAMAVATCQSAKLPKMKSDVIQRVVEATQGLAEFPARQAMQLSMTEDCIDTEAMWQRKRSIIESTRGLNIWRGKERLDAIFGLNNAIDYVRGFLKNISLVVFLDELEKMMAGSGGDGSAGDNTGVSQALHRYLLTYMSDHEIMAVMLIGPPGTGKTMLAKAAGNEAAAPVMSLDVDGLKNKWLGDSEGFCRTAFKTIHAVGQGRILLIATCNSIERLSPELRSRFMDTFFVELPDQEARGHMWTQYCREYDLNPSQKKPADEGWTGREIKACCRKAKLRGSSILDAGQYVVPVAVSMADRIAQLRASAHEKYLSAAVPGLYKKPAINVVDPFRRVTAGEAGRLNVQDK